MNDSQFRVFFEGRECEGFAPTARVSIGWDNELPEDTMGVSVKLNSEADRTLRSKLQTVERARIKQEHPPIDFDGYVVILDRSWSELMGTAHYTLVPVRLPPSLSFTGRIDVPPHLRAEPTPLPEGYVDLDIKLPTEKAAVSLDKKDQAAVAALEKMLTRIADGVSGAADELASLRFRLNETQCSICGKHYKSCDDGCPSYALEERLRDSSYELTRLGKIFSDWIDTYNVTHGL